MSTCTTCEKRVEYFCASCKEGQCFSCIITAHLIKNEIRQHKIQFVCQECEECEANFVCNSCEQNLCDSCNTKIHNKGKRAQHERSPCTSYYNLKNIKLIAYLSFDFLVENFDFKDIKSFEKKVHELTDEISQNLVLSENENSLYFSFFCPERISNPEIINSIKAFQQLEQKHIIFLSEKALNSFNQTVLFLSRNQESQIDSIQSTTASIIYNFIAKFETVKYVFIYDRIRNPILASLLKKTELMNGISYFLNGNSKKNLLEASFYINSPTEIPKTNLNRKMDLMQNLKNKNDSDLISFNGSPSSENNPINKSLNKSPSVNFDEQLVKSIYQQYSSKKLTQGNGVNHQMQNSKNSQIQFYQSFKPDALTESPITSIYLQNELMNFASQGELLVSKEKFIEKIMSGFNDTFKKVEDLIKRAEETGVIHSTIRKFSDSKEYVFLGLLLDHLSIESLVWIIRSIKNDLMTPTEKLVLSRIKESFGLKIDQSTWKNITNTIKNQKKINPELSKKIPLKIEKITEKQSNSETIAIYIIDEKWIPEDQIVIDENSIGWTDFVTFLETFFKEDDSKVIKPQNLSLSNLDQPKTGSLWISSIENNSIRSGNKKDKSINLSENLKAIPGGRYGCAQFVKTCGNDLLKKLSIGKLTAYVQEAINKGIVRYQKTFIIKNTFNDSVSFNLTDGDISNSIDQSQDGNRVLLNRMKEVLIHLLEENPDGIPLAQIPLHLRKILDCSINFQQLGFPKLKNFLSSIEEIVIVESSGNNHSYATLSEKYKTKNMNLIEIQDPQYKEPATPEFKKFISEDKMRTPYDPEEIPGKKPFKLTDSVRLSNLKPKKKVSTTEEYLLKIKSLIQAIVIENPYGLTIQNLYMEMCRVLRFEFDPKIFECDSFYDFLMLHLESIIDVQIKRDTLMIYPKNAYFANKDIFQSQTREPNNSGTRKTLREKFSEKKNTNLNLQANPFSPIMQDNFDGMSPMKSRSETTSEKYNQFKSPMTNDLRYRQQNSREGNNNFTPLLINSIDEDLGTPDRTSNTHTGSESFWNHGNMNFENRILMISNINTAIHSRSDSKVTRHPEESHLEISENLKFIEELLKDNDDDKISLTTFTPDKNSDSFIGLDSPSLSFMGITAILPQNHKFSHLKTLSEDFSQNKALGHNHMANHARVNSVFYKQNNV